MTTRNLFFLVATLAAIACAAAQEDSNCPWRTVADVNSRTVQGYGSWALEHTTLSFQKVENATAQAVGDNCDDNIKSNYALIILATNRAGGEVNKYKALVYVESTIPTKLISLGFVVKRRPPPAN